MGEKTKTAVKTEAQTLALELTFPPGRKGIIDSEDCLDWLASIALVCLESGIGLQIHIDGELVEIRRLRLDRGKVN